jgi:Uma2 family endonuclease
MITTGKRLRSRHDTPEVLFWDASWELYEAILKEYDELPSHINYDDGVLELMVLSTEHERYKSFIGSMLDVIALERRISMERCGSNTLKQMKKRKGLEPDECFYIANEKHMRSVKRIDLNVDPPPDLVVEVDVTHHVVDREAIYAAFGVPEMWRFKKGTLEPFALRDGAWRPIEFSLSFPFLRPADLNPFIARLGVDSATTILIDFRDWVRAQMAK